MLQTKVLFLLVASLVVSVSLCALAIDEGIDSVTPYSIYQPFIDYGNAWSLSPLATPGKVGSKEFYFAEMGNYIRMNKETEKRFIETGILQKMIPGHWFLKYFDPAVYAKLPPVYRKIVDDYLRNRWQFFSVEYVTAKGNPLPCGAALEAVKDIWLGDGMAEAPIYRLEPVKHFLETGKLWVGSSMDCTKEDAMVDYLKNVLLPKLKKDIPDCENPNKNWTRCELRQLCDIYCDTFTRQLKPLVWTSYLSPYFMAEKKGVTAVGQKDCNAHGNALTRGIMHQGGGNKIFCVWRGHEPTERYYYPKTAWYNDPGREGWGLPLPFLRYYIFRPFLCGANWYSNECMPESLIEDIEGTGDWSLTPLGQIAMDMLDYSERHPDRGIPYCPVALLDNYDMTSSLFPLVFKVVDSDLAAESMNMDIEWNLLFPEHRDLRYSGAYTRTAPYGEIIDILQPNPYKKVAPELFDGYKLLVMCGGQKMTPEYVSSLKEYIEHGGTVLINAADARNLWPEDILGTHIGPTFKAATSRNSVTGRSFKENPFTAYELTLAKGTTVLFTTADGKPLVVRSDYGKGHIVLVGARYMVQDTVEKMPYFVTDRELYLTSRQPLLKFVPDLFEHMLTGLTPFDLRVPPDDKPDISWQINRKGNGWTLTLYNYSLRREALLAKARGVACVDVSYPLKEVPFEIICRDAAMKDVVELYGDREVNWRSLNGKMTIQETIHGGEIRVYEFQPRRMEFPERERYVNYALKRPVKASSSFMADKPELAVDGSLDNDKYWASGMYTAPIAGNKAYAKYAASNEYQLPQWLQVDLGQARRIDHIIVKLHYNERATPETRMTIVKFIVEASLDDKTWTTIVDKSKNILPVTEYGMERWFTPVSARYVRLTGLKNSAASGIRVVEIMVYGQGREKYKPGRRSIIPKWHIEFPPQVTNAPKAIWLSDVKPQKAQVGWIFPGKTWEAMNGEIKLYTGDNEGLACPKSLFAESVSDIVYIIPTGAEWFACIPGIGAPTRDASVEFEVYVDGTRKYRSPRVVQVGQPLCPVVVKVIGGRELRLHVTDGGDGPSNDYSWWGSPRFILR